jgi:UDP-glucose 4-epimerase
VHFAAKSLVGESTVDPSLYWRNNVGGTLALLESVRAAGVGRVVFSSSAAVYGDPDEVPIPETAATRPASPYGATKLAIDLALGDYAAAFGLTTTSLRYFNVAGALLDGGTRVGERHGTETHLIPLALDAVRGARPALKLFGEDYPTPDGTCIRDYVHVIDLADAHVKALELAEAGTNQIINLGSSAGYSVREVLKAVQEVTGQDVPLEPAPRRAGDPATSVASNAKARDVLGWQPGRDLQQMVADAWSFAQEY